MPRFARRTDTTQTAIVTALRAAGWLVYVIEEPCDLLVYNPATDVWRTLEAKTPRNKRGDPRIDKRQVKQNEFLAATNTPRVTSPEAALKAIGAQVTFEGVK